MANNLRSKAQKTLALCLTMVLAAGTLTACGNSSQGSGSNGESTDSSAVSAAESGKEGEDASNSNEVVTIQLLQVGSGLTEEDNSMVTKKVAENIGVNVQPVVVTEDRLNVLMASGDMEADLITAQGGTGQLVSQRLIEGALVQPLDDLIAAHGQDIQENAAAMLNFSKEFGSYGKNQIYFVRSNTGDFETLAAKNRPYNYGIAPFIRWDYYEELGSPAVTNEDEFLDLLRQMQDKHPKNDQGQDAYAMSLTLTDLWNINTFYGLCNGVGYVGGYYTNRDVNDKIVSNALKPDDALWRTLSYYNKAQRLGILDPESFTQKGENVTEKATTNRLFYTENSWNNYNTILAESDGETAGFEPLYEAFPTVYGGDEGNFGWNYQIGISSKSENPEAAMKWINYLYNWDGARLRRNGIEGVHWNYVDGIPTVAEDVIANNGDETWNKENGLDSYGNYTGFATCITHPDGYPVDLRMMPEYLKKKNLPIDTKFSEKYGAEYPGGVPDKLTGENGKVHFWLSDAVNIMPPMPDNLIRIRSKGDDILLKAAPKMILAESEEAFHQQRDETIKQLENIGIQQVIDWAIAEFEKAQTSLETLEK